MPPASARTTAWREIAAAAFAALAYFGIRNLTVGSEADAFANADRLMRVEEWASLDWEETLQAQVTTHEALVTLANWVYIWGHWPVIITTAVLLYRWRRRSYFLLRNAIFASAAIGFSFFIFFPVAPPRLLELGLLDTVTLESHSYRALQPPGLTNQYAAFPSLHAGWNVLLGTVVFLSTASVVIRILAVLVPSAMVWAVVATANHFVIDVVAGIVVVAAGLAVATAVSRRARREPVEKTGSPAPSEPRARGADCPAWSKARARRVRSWPSAARLPRSHRPHR